ncbi:MAG: ATP-binding protein [Candidatus Saccharimonadales bacterium]
MLDDNAQKQRLTATIAAAGKRYDTTVNLRVQSMYDHLNALNRDPEYITEILRMVYKIKRDRYLDWTIEVYPKRAELTKIRNDLRIVTDRLFTIKDLDKNKNINWSKLRSRLSSAASELFDQYSELREIEEEKKKKAGKDERYYARDLWTLYREVSDLSNFLRDKKPDLFNKPRLLLKGEAGIGKTHLLCDYAKERIEANKPTIIFLAHELLGTGGVNDPIARMSSMLGFKNDKQFLKALEEASKKSKERVCIIIDAINEADQLKWQQLTPLYAINGISLVVSLRNGYDFLVKDTSKYTAIEHSGFAEMEWEAVPLFFNQYGLKLPEIPIIDPEFKNPLFLSIFCTAYSDKRKTPRGKGATDAFEQYIEHQSKTVINELGLTLQHDYLWNNVIKQMGVWMGRNGKDRVLRKKLLEIIQNDKNLAAHSTQLIVLMERHGLLIKYPHYAKGKRNGYNYKFTYNRFSDHLIVRSILTENDIQGVDASEKAKVFFENNPFLERTITQWNKGLVEALAVQIPERCKGDELVWLVPKKYSDLEIMKSAFIEGLKWRDVSSKDKKTDELKFINTEQVLKYMNTYFVHSKYDMHTIIGVILDVCAIPGHPFNANKLHSHLNRFKLGKRDAWWQDFLISHTSETGNAINRIHSWSFSELSNKASDESVLLASVALSWTLASTDGKLRDTSTRAMVAILQNHQEALFTLLTEYFADTDDPYIAERLFAVAYGALSLNPKDKMHFKRIAEYIYKKHFLNEERTPNALIDDYAKGIVELYLRNYKNDIGIKIKKITPPFKYYQFPSRIPTIATLKKKYKGEDKDYYTIWGSLMYGEGEALADFGNYTLGSRLRPFSNIPLGTTVKTTDREKHNKFVKSLNKKQKALFDTYNTIKFNASYVPLTAYIKSRAKTKNKVKKPSKAEVDQALDAFIKSLGLFKKRRYNLLKKYIVGDEHLPGIHANEFNPNIARRWVFKRVIKLGWTPEDHLDFDKARGSYDRIQSGSAERIGKKYQWIGLFEFAAILGSNYYFFDDAVWNEEKLTHYHGAYQTYMRDIDPTIDPRWLYSRRKNSKDSLKPWWLPEYSAWDRKDWKFSTDDIPKPSKIIEVTKDNKVYLNLYSRIAWKGEKDHPEDENSNNYPELWMHVTGYIVRNKDLPKVLEWSKDKEFWNNALPDINDSSNGVFLKELINSSAYTEAFNPYRDASGWVRKESEGNAFDILPPIETYSSGSFDTDKTIDDHVRVYVPSGFLRDKMKLHLGDDIGEYVSTDKKLRMYDPSTNMPPGDETVLVDKDVFLKKLNKHDLVICWTILGEKLYFGDDLGYRGQRLEIHGFCYFDKNGKLIENIRHKNEWKETP